MLNFLCIGAQKAGTTWLYDKLRQHPGICFPGGKEVHYWDQFRDRGLDWYTGLFDGPDGCVRGEITPAYAVLPPETICEIHQNFPDIRLIYIIRNPIERVWSAACMALDYCRMRQEEASDRWFMDYFMAAGTHARGDYETCIRNWLSCFPKESLLVLRFEEISENPRALLERCCVHLGVAPSLPDFSIPLEVALHVGNRAPVRTTLLPVLRAIHDPQIRSLSAYLGEDLSCWLDCGGLNARRTKPAPRLGLMEPSRKLVVVLGMHRSGTSVAARAMDALGADLGDALMPADVFNEKGYWEDADVFSLNEAMMRSIGREWHDLGPLEEGHLLQLREGSFFSAATDLVEKRLARGGVQAVKDPRFACLLPFWKTVFEACGIAPIFMLVLRDPRAIMHSLMHRNQIPREKCLWLWVESVLGSITEVGAGRALVVSYERVLDSPAREVARMAAFVGLPVDGQRLREFSDSFLDRRLDHAPPKGEVLPAEVTQIYERLSAAAADDVPLTVDPQELTAWNHWYRSVEGLLRLTTAGDRTATDMARLAVERLTIIEQQRQRNTELEQDLRRTLERLEASESDVRSKIASLIGAEQTIRSHERQIVLLRSQAQKATTKTEALVSSLAAMEHRIGELTDRFDAQKRALAPQLRGINEIMTGAAWKITTRWRENGCRTESRRSLLDRMAASASIFFVHFWSGRFDPIWYRRVNAGVHLLPGLSLLHFALKGAFEGRAPVEGFDSSAYLELNPDVAEQGIVPGLHYMLWGWHEGRTWVRPAGAPPEASPPTSQQARPEEYHEWITDHEPAPMDAGCIEGGPLISVLLPVFKVKYSFLERAVRSVIGQSYANWELCIATGDSEDMENLGMLKAFSTNDPRIRVLAIPNGGISANTNVALEMATGEFIALLDHDDELAAFALADMAAAVAATPDADFLYSDKDSLEEESAARVNALFKPEWSPESMYSVNYPTHLNLVRRQLAVTVGGFRPQTDGAQDWDFFMRVSEKARRIVRVPGIHYHWRIHSNSTSTGLACKPYVPKAQLTAVRDALSRRKLPAEAVPCGDLGFHIRWQGTPRIHVLLDAVGAAPEAVVTFVQSLPESMVFSIVADAPNARDLEMRFPGRVHAVETDGDPAIAETRAVGRALATAGEAPEVHVFLSGRVWQITPGGIEELANWASRHPEVAVASAVILDADGLVVEAGLVVDCFGRGSPMFRGSPLRQWGWMGGPLWYRNCTACSPWAVAVNARVLREAGGLDETFAWPRAFVALCGAIRGHGWRGVVDPHVQATLLAGSLPSVPPFHDSLRDDPYFHPAFCSVVPLRLRKGAAPADTADCERISEYSQEAMFHAGACRATADQLIAPQQHPERVGRGPGKGWCNWFLPEIRNPAYGGAMTILRFADCMRRRRGVRHRFYMLGHGDAVGFRSAVCGLYPALQDSEINTVTFDEAVGLAPPADYAVATLWTTAYALLRIRNAGLKFYFVQDYEPLFYPAGSTQAQAALTYEMGFYGITNTRPLRDLYEREHGGKAVHFVPQVDPAVFHGRPSRRGNRTKRIFFYARPGNPRNGFELVAEALSLLKRRLGHGIDIVCAGAEFDAAAYGLHDVVTNLGLLGYRETGDLYRSCDVGVVMMMTRHPSYLPMELMACGVLTISNRNPFNSWLLRDGENCLLSAPSPDALAAKLEYAVTEYEHLYQLRQSGCDMISSQYSDWDAAFRPVVEAIDAMIVP